MNVDGRKPPCSRVHHGGYRERDALEERELLLLLAFTCIPTESETITGEVRGHFTRRRADVMYVFRQGMLLSTETLFYKASDSSCAVILVEPSLQPLVDHISHAALPLIPETSSSIQPDHPTHVYGLDSQVRKLPAAVKTPSTFPPTRNFADFPARSRCSAGRIGVLPLIA
ncbi:hypothetical protein MRX96_055406 [Rhipicephalus microplus]